MVGRLACHLLRRQITKLTLQPAAAVLRRLHPVLEARDAEVTELHRTIARQ
jgi:hypothetical protein